MRSVLGIVLAVLAWPVAAAGQVQPPRPDTTRLFVDAYVLESATSLSDSRTFTRPFVVFSEVGTSRATYPAPGRSNHVPIDINVGYWLVPQFGVLAGFAQTRFTDSAHVVATVPHPVFVNAAATGSLTTPAPLTRTETMMLVAAAIMPVRTPRAQVRMYAGPSLFMFRADMVHELVYTHQFSSVSPQSTVTIDGYSLGRGTGRGIGFHVGLDVAYFVRERIGIVGGVRFSRGKVDFSEPLSGITQEMRTGGTQIVLGARFRVGR